MAPAGQQAARRRAAHPGSRAVRPGPADLAIIAATLLALALRLWQLTRPGYLFGLTEYDDGPYFGSAVRLVSGALPYRDFVLVQPPGITLLMTPAALAGKLAGTARAMAAGRILTALASTAGVPLTGLLVRHRGVVATTVACGFLAVYPDSVAAAHTVLVEPWLAVFCLAGAVAVFDGDRLAGARRLAWGGAAFGFAGAVEAWAIVPVLAVLVLCLCRPRRAAVFAAGVAAGFAVPVLPFAAAAPERFYQSLIVAQIGPRPAFPAPAFCSPRPRVPLPPPSCALPRSGVSRVPIYPRLTEMSGLTYLHPPGPAHLGMAQLPDHTVVALCVMSLVLFMVGGLAVVTLAARRPPAPLECFALGTTALVVGMFLWPSQFHYHFCAFLAPYLAVAIALPAAAIAGRSWGRPLAAGLAAVLVVVSAVIGVRAESQLRPDVTPATIEAAARLIPPGSCVVTDEVSLLLLADRFTAARPGCSPVLDGLGTDLALSGGLKPATGAGRVPAVAAVWRRAFEGARFVWLSTLNRRRIAWSPALRAYFIAHFARVRTDRRGDALYRRTGGGGAKRGGGKGRAAARQRSGG